MLCSAKKENPSLPFQGGVKLMFASMLPSHLRRYAPKKYYSLLGIDQELCKANFPFFFERDLHTQKLGSIDCVILILGMWIDFKKKKRRKKFQDSITLKTHHRLNPPVTAQIVERGLVSRVRK